MEPDMRWRKSSYSGSEGGDCIEVAVGLSSVAPVRDSKDPNGPALTFAADEWRVFVADLRAGCFPLHS
jgi:hypothetical protein